MLLSPVATTIAIIFFTAIQQCTCWQWKNSHVNEEFQIRSFPARDGHCTVTYYNITDKTNRIAIFGGSSLNSGDERIAFLDLWISGSKLSHKWIQVQREFDITGKPMHSWPAARWDHTCSGLQSNFQDVKNNIQRYDNITNTTVNVKDLPPFTFISMGGRTTGNVLNNDVWHCELSMTGWPIVAKWKINDETESICLDCSKSVPTEVFGNIACQSCEAGQNQDDKGNPSCTRCITGKFEVEAMQKKTKACKNCPKGWYFTTKTFANTNQQNELSKFSPRSGHCSLDINVQGYHPYLLKNYKFVSITPTDDHPSLLAARDPTYKNPDSDLMPTTMIFVLGGLSTNGFRGDTWMSVDRGLNWELRSRRGYSARYFHACSNLGRHKLVVLGGRSKSAKSVMNDVWTSMDYGRTWNTIAASTKRWAPRYRFSVVSFVSRTDSLTVSIDTATTESIYNSNNKNDNSNNNNNKNEAEDDKKSYRLNKGLSGSKHLLCLIGGYSSGSSTFYNDMWVSNDGDLWTKQFLDAPMFNSWQGRSGHSAVLLPGIYSKTASKAAAVSGHEFTIEFSNSNNNNNNNNNNNKEEGLGGGKITEHAQIHAFPMIVVMGGRSLSKRLSDVWQREGPILLIGQGASLLPSWNVWFVLILSIAIVNGYINQDIINIRDQSIEFVQACGHRDDTDLNEHIIVDTVASSMPVEMQQKFDSCNLPRATALSTALTSICAKMTGDNDSLQKPNVNANELKLSLLTDNGVVRTMRAPGKSFQFLRIAKEIEDQLKRKQFGLAQVAEKLLNLAESMTEFVKDLTAVEDGDDEVDVVKI